MSDTSESIFSVINQLDIEYKGGVISKEHLIKGLNRFLADTIDKDKHNVDLVFHTGSDCFDAFLVVYAALACIMYDNRVVDEIIDTLEVGDYVLYGKSRCVYQGKTNFDGALMIKLQDKENSTTYVPEKRWHLISPYGRDARSVGGRGVRRNNAERRKEFISLLLKCPVEEVPDVINVSTVIVMSRERVNDLVDNITIQYEKGKKLHLLDFINASYYTENDEYRFRGNAAGIEPILKFTGKVSTARRLLREGDNNNFGVLVMDEDCIRRGINEVQDLLRRKKTMFAIAALGIGSEFRRELLDNNEGADTFSCTKDFILSMPMGIVEDNDSTRELEHQSSIIVDRAVVPVVCSGPLSWKEYRLLRRKIHQLRSNDYDSEERNNFIVQAFSLTNLFTTLPLSMDSVEMQILSGNLDGIASPKQKIDELRVWANSFPGVLKTTANEIVSCLSEVYGQLLSRNSKEEELKKYIIEDPKKKVAVIVPKKYYCKVLENVMGKRRRLSFFTANSFDNKTYDVIVCVADIEGKRFNSFRSFAAQDIYVLLYEYETHTFKYKKKQSDKLERYCNSRSMLPVDMDEYDELELQEPFNEQDVEELLEMDIEAEKYLEKLNQISAFSVSGQSGGGSSSNTLEVVATALFETGERIYFSKMYKAYVLEKENGITKEEKVENLCEGDSLLFMKNNDETRDIVDYVLQSLIERKLLSEEQVLDYSKSRRWRDDLTEYMNKKGMSPMDVANEMISNGASVVPQTITNWINPDTHIVGPKDIESFRQIASLTGDTELLTNTESFYLACKVVRKLRRQILKEIGRMMNGFSMEDGAADIMFDSDIKKRIEQLSEVLTIETITPITGEVPINKANRPLEV